MLSFLLNVGSGLSFRSVNTPGASEHGRGLSRSVRLRGAGPGPSAPSPGHVCSALASGKFRSSHPCVSCPLPPHPCTWRVEDTCINGLLERTCPGRERGPDLTSQDLLPRAPGSDVAFSLSVPGPGSRLCQPRPGSQPGQPRQAAMQLYNQPAIGYLRKSMLLVSRDAPTNRGTWRVWSGSAPSPVASKEPSV